MPEKTAASKNAPGATHTAAKRDPVADARRLGKDLNEASALADDLKAFADIPESWLDGGAPQERYDTLFRLLKDKGSAHKINSAAKHSESWLKHDQGATTASISKFWADSHAASYELEGVPGLVDEVYKELGASVAYLNALATYRDRLLALEGKAESKDDIDSVISEMVKAADEASAVFSHAAYDLRKLARDQPSYLGPFW